MSLHSQLIKLLDGGWAHAGIQDIVEEVPPQYRAKKVRGLPYTLWDLLEHIRLSQRDILEYLRDPGYEAPEWPADYWPTEKKPDREMWEASGAQLLKVSVQVVDRALPRRAAASARADSDERRAAVP